MKALIDAGPIIAAFNRRDERHDEVIAFFNKFEGQFVTTSPVIAECMWLLKKASVPVQTENKLLLDVAHGNYQLAPLDSADFERIADLNEKYADRPANFADLSLVVISERLHIPKIAAFDADFDVYRRLQDGYFERIGFFS